MFSRSTVERKEVVVKSVSLLGHVVKDILDTGIPLTPVAVMDLLGAYSPAEIKQMTDRSAIVADNLTILKAIKHLQDRGVNDIVAYVSHNSIRVSGEKEAIAGHVAIQKYDPGFVLAALMIPPEVCRWYALDILSSLNSSEFTEDDITPDGMIPLESMFDSLLLANAIKSYLRGNADASWIEIFGLYEMAKLAGDDSSNFGLIDCLLRLFDDPSDQTISDIQSTVVVDDAAVKRIRQAKEKLGGVRLLHYRQVESICKAYDNFSSLAVDTVQDEKGLDFLLASLRTHALSVMAKSNG